ncbi:toxin [Streptomyces sp. CB00316]|uniref:DUF397 domain-containing protein n=1 Tax=unclassified Streptomyces TaxID=2593676 RepID=UPI00093F1BB3|nr:MULTISPECIES: DUF397 domain-containing protein [unclassified Streptomyces]MBT2379642.1 DUF397 domain-containing protein [Streptomyces sp. ISL-111]MBT2426764.1 DUF397 domain-containing protein [Streptomyces sp. ISL-112]MBT2463341.1 DUF397 domain-containing protein [Streptomyces sp. ISL-63]OKJ19098.1 toxin [Streptomyces sp. CB00316]
MIQKPSAGDASELEWIKSSYSSSGDGNDCVEVATAPDAVHVRDSKSPHGPRLTVTPAAWTGFVPYAAGR